MIKLGCAGATLEHEAALYAIAFLMYKQRYEPTTRLQAQSSQRRRITVHLHMM